MRVTFRQVTAVLILLGSAGCALPGPERAHGADRDLSPPRESISVDEWPVVKAEDAAMPEFDKAQLIAEVEKFVNKCQTFSSWEAKYQATLREQVSTSPQDTIPAERITTTEVHLMSEGPKWSYQILQERKGRTPNVHHEKVSSDGRVIHMIWPAWKVGKVKEPGRHRISGNIPTLVNFLPYLPAESCLASRDFPKLLDILDDRDTKLLPGYTRVDGHMCYVLEQTTKREKPIFRASQEAANWKKDTNSPPIIRVDTTKTRLAIDPELNFAIVRWALGIHTELPGLRLTTFPLEEIIYGDFRQVSDGTNIPWQMTYTSYAFDKDGAKKVNNQTRIELEEFAADRQYDPGLFELDFPGGYQVMDISRGITYTVGDSKQQTDALVAAARRRAAFYDSLRNKDAPALEASQWLNTAPISLAEQKGRPIILHFWAIDCAPCMYELPELQKQYGQTQERTSDPLFISIHPFVDGDYLKQLKNIVEKKGITFPVMVDSLGTERLSWGKTFKKYMVFSIPTEVKIDKNGHFVEIDEEYITSSSWWMKNPELE
ncbi:MAG: TlpA family protein disulfide reductase [Planctomycetota bacterium]|nr:MAG: TlpA family protein disulfide reductase [Planctomycetota bacterium]